MNQQFFGTTFWRGLTTIAVLYGLALLGYTTNLSAALMGGLVLSGAYLAYKQTDRALILVFLELFSNPHGQLLQTDIAGQNVSLRMALFAGVMFGWFVGVLIKRHPLRIQHDDRIKPFVLLAVAIVVGFVIGGLSNPISLTFTDGNAYFYLLYILPILSVDWNAARRAELIQVFTAGAVWIGALSIILLYVFTHFSEPVLQATYAFFRDLRVAEITALGEGVYRVFIQSQAFTVMLGLFVFAMTMHKPSFKRTPIILLALAIAMVLLGLSRSFWVGVIPSVLVVFLMSWYFNKPKRKESLVLIKTIAMSGVVAVVVLALAALFPIPSQNLTSAELADAFTKRSTETDDVAVSSRWKLLTPMLNEIFESPLVGSGFGATVTFQTDDPRVREINPDGTWTTYAMEWGWFELWIKMGVLGPLGFLAAAYFIIHALKSYLWTEHAWLAIGFIGILTFLYTTHFFSPYLNHPIGLGMLLFMVPFFPTKTTAEAQAVEFVTPIVGKRVAVLQSKSIN